MTELENKEQLKQTKSCWVKHCGNMAELRKLRRNPEIESLVVTDDAILVTTKTLMVDTKDGRQSIDHWGMTIKLGGQYEMEESHQWLTPSIRFRNLVKESRFISAGYMGGWRVVCFGNTLPMVRALYKQGRFAALIILCIRFLKETTRVYHFSHDRMDAYGLDEHA